MAGVVISTILIVGTVVIFSRIQSSYEVKKNIVFTFKCEKIEPDVIKLIKKGDRILNSAGGMFIGKISDINIKPFFEPVQTDTGKLVLAKDPYNKTIYVKVSGKGIANDSLTAMRNEVIQAGKFFKLVSAKYSLDGKISNIEVMD